MQRSAVQSRSGNRRAFTLVELLISMSIIVILATLAVSGFRAAYDADRVGEAASILRGGIEGARSRAIKAKEKRGLRLLLDPSDGRTVTSIVYIGPPETVEGYLRFEYDNTNSTEGASQGQWRVFDDSEGVDPTNIINWRNLYRRGLLRAQCQIVIDGTPYTMTFRSQYGSMTPGEDDAWVVSPAYANSAASPAGQPPENTLGGQRPNNAEVSETSTSTPSSYGLPTAVCSQRMPYTLTLLSAVLDGAAPVNLPVNTCIDLDGSKLPATWRPYTTGLSKYGPALGGELRPMDILFNSSGRVDRSLITEGFLHFRLANVTDLLDARVKLTGSLPNNTGSYVVIKDPEHQAKIVTLVTQTGMLRISNVTGEGETGNPPSYNDEIISSGNPFQGAILGREAKR